MQIRQTGEPLPQPNVCFICQSAFTAAAGETRPIVDTMRDFEPAAITPLTGRKLVCADCVHTMATLLGYLSPEDHTSILDELDKLQERLRSKVEEIVSDKLHDVRAALESALRDLSSKEDRSDPFA